MTDLSRSSGDRDSLVTASGTLEGATLGAPGGDIGQGASSERQASLASDAWRELRRRPMFWVSAVLIAMFLLMAIAPGLFTDNDPAACDLSRFSLQGPSREHWFGYDFQGCDLYARVIYGARASISVGIIVTVLATLIGGLTGAVAGYYGRATDAVLSRLVDVFYGIPLVLGALVVLSIFRLPGIWGVVLALTMLNWTIAARIMRSSVIATRNADYVVAARALGAGDRRVLVRHVLPNAVAPLVVVAMINLGIIISTEATLSFLGIGLQPPTISWGIMISGARDYFLEAPHILVFPSLALSLTVLSFILLGDAVRDALDPKLR